MKYFVSDSAASARRDVDAYLENVICVHIHM